MKVIACIEDQVVIDKILAHLTEKEGDLVGSVCLSEARESPQKSLFDKMYSRNDAANFKWSAGIPVGCCS